MTNVSKKDVKIDKADLQFVEHHLRLDQPLWDLSNEFLEATLARAFENRAAMKARLAEFREVCSRRHHNFRPPRAKDAGETAAPSAAPIASAAPLPETDDGTGPSSNIHRAIRGAAGEAPR
jgi:hypothetical protein